MIRVGTLRFPALLLDTDPSACVDLTTDSTACMLEAKVVVKNILAMASALQWMHKKGLVHQDLHAGNVLQSRDGQQWKLVDFGIAAWSHQPDGSPTQVPASM